MMPLSGVKVVLTRKLGLDDTIRLAKCATSSKARGRILASAVRNISSMAELSRLSDAAGDAEAVAMVSNEYRYIRESRGQGLGYW